MWILLAGVAALAGAAGNSRVAHSKRALVSKKMLVGQLTAKDVGLWGAVPWVTPADHLSAGFNKRVKDFDFGIRCIRIAQNPNLTVLAQSLSELNSAIADGESTAPQKRMIIEVDFWDGSDRYRASPPVQTADYYEKKIALAMDQVHWQSPTVLGITLAEENSPQNNGRAAILHALYYYCHKRYPGIFVFQWFSPNTTLPSVFQGVKIPADGYIINPYSICVEMYPPDKYNMGLDPYLYVLKKYMLTGKPVIDQLCASNAHAEWYNPNDPKNTYFIDEWNIVEHEFRTNQAYNIPMCFYWDDFNPITHIGSTTFDGLHPSTPLQGQINSSIPPYVVRAHSG